MRVGSGTLLRREEAVDVLLVLGEELAELERCCLHNPQWTIAEVAEVVAWSADSPEGYGSEYQVVLVRLKDGDYGVLTSTADTTGHGCQCGSLTARAFTLGAALDHLHEDEVRLLLDPTHGTLAAE